MRVVAFGTYQRDYPRFAQAHAAWRHAGIEVEERRRAVWDGRREAWSAGAATAARLVAAQAALARARAAGDVLYVGYPGHLDLPAARRVARGRPIVFDPLVSLRDTLVADRARFRSGAAADRALRAIDRFAFRHADAVVADTAAHARFFASAFGLDPLRVHVVPMGADDSLFASGPRPNPSVDVLFVGKLIPLHGLETLLATARALPQLRFRLVGDGQQRRLLRERPANVRWEPWLPLAALPQAYRGAAVALGIFGTSAKAGRVLPNKAYHALATATPLVTADTDASRELLAHGRDAVLVPPGDPTALAAALGALVPDAEARARLGAAGRLTYERHAALPVLAARWQQLLERLLG